MIYFFNTCMGKALLFLVCSFWTLTVHGQEYRIFIDPQSKVKVYGSTNVNHFTFDYTENISIDKPVNVKIQGGILKINGGYIDLKVQAFDSGNPIMNKDFRKMMNDEENPFIQVELTSIQPTWEGEVWREGKVDIVIEMNSIRKRYTIQCKIDKPGSLLIYGREKVKLTDFKLEPPVRMMGMVKVNEYVDFDLSLRFVTDR